MLLKIMGTLALLSTGAVNHAPQSASKAVAPKVVAKAAPAKSTEVQVAKADEKKAEPAKAEASPDAGTATPKKGGGKK